jgi:hypothetical protein
MIGASAVLVGAAVRRNLPAVRRVTPASTRAACQAMPLCSLVRGGKEQTAVTTIFTPRTGTASTTREHLALRLALGRPGLS